MMDTSELVYIFIKVKMDLWAVSKHNYEFEAVQYILTEYSIYS